MKMSEAEIWFTFMTGTLAGNGTHTQVAAKCADEALGEFKKRYYENYHDGVWQPVPKEKVGK